MSITIQLPDDVTDDLTRRARLAGQSESEFAAAVAARAEAIVTGDKDLLVLRSYAGVPIVAPAECAAILGGV